MLKMDLSELLLCDLTIKKEESNIAKVKIEKIKVYFLKNIYKKDTLINELKWN
jgi:hypothetical protein